MHGDRKGGCMVGYARKKCVEGSVDKTWIRLHRSFVALVKLVKTGRRD